MQTTPDVEEFRARFARLKAGPRQLAAVPAWLRVVAESGRFKADTIRIPKRCKGVHRVDLGESFPTRIEIISSD